MTSIYNSTTPETFHLWKILLAGIGAYVIASLTACGARMGNSVIGSPSFVDAIVALEKVEKEYDRNHK